MKNPATLIFSICFIACLSPEIAADPLPSAAPAVSATSFRPAKNYQEDQTVSFTFKNCTMSEVAPVLANLTQKEVLVSDRVLRVMLPDIDVSDHPKEAEHIVVEKIKSANIRIGELLPYALVCFDCPEPMLGSVFKLK